MVSPKMEAMAIGLATPPPPLQLLDDTLVRYTQRFKLLGSWLPSNDDDMRTRIGIAWDKLREYKRWWKNPHLSRVVKRDLFT